MPKNYNIRTSSSIKLVQSEKNISKLMSGWSEVQRAESRFEQKREISML